MQCQLNSACSQWLHGGQSATPDSKKCQQLGKRGKKSGKIWKKDEKSGRQGKNWEGSFTLPLLTDRVGYATACSHCLQQDILLWWWLALTGVLYISWRYIVHQLVPYISWRTISCLQLCLPIVRKVLAATEDMQHCATVVATKGTLTKWEVCSMS